MGLGDLVARLAWDGSPFEQGTARAKRQLDGLDAAFARVGNKWKSTFFTAFAAGAVVRMGRALGEDVKEINELAEKFGLTTDHVQMLQQEAERTNVEFKELAKNALEIEASLKNAAEHGAKPIYTREQLGAVEDLSTGLSGVWKNVKQIAAETARQAHYIFAGGMKHDLDFLLGFQAQPFTQAKPKPTPPGAPGSKLTEAEMLEFDLAFEHEKARGERAIKFQQETKRRIAGVEFDINSDALTSVGNFLGSTPGSQVALEQANQKIDRIIQIMERESGFKFNPWPF